MDILYRGVKDPGAAVGEFAAQGDALLLKQMHQNLRPQRTKIPVIVDVHPLHTVETILEAARVDLGLGDAPLSEFTITCNGHSAKPSMTMKALGLHKGMVNGDNYPVLMIDSTAPNGGRI